MLTSGARESEDLTTDKTDDKDAVLIARLTTQLRCYLPEPVDETWGRLRHLGTRREQLLDEHVACVQQIRDLLECVWPAAVTTAQQPFKSHTWLAAMQVIMTRDGGDFTRTRRLGPARFEHAVRRELTRRGKIRPCLRILRNLYTALADPAGVIEHRLGAFERISWLIEDWDTARAKLADTEARMVAVLDDLELTELACSIKGLSPVGAATRWQHEWLWVASSPPTVGRTARRRGSTMSLTESQGPLIVQKRHCPRHVSAFRSSFDA
jgi:transposase